ncbi:MAG: hypothetical protein QOG64_3094, partial [Acidimicrobiaceae bacterium]|nr:hypothetical protein [Acidimicrobiaceae bacterium]
RHYTVDLRARTDLAAFRPVQQPRPPVWVVGAWPSPKSMTRVLRCDGWLPHVEEPTPATVAAGIDWIRAAAPERTIDIVMEGETPPDDHAEASAIVRPWADAGCSWWLDTRWGPMGEPRIDEARHRLAAGPPRL